MEIGIAATAARMPEIPTEWGQYRKCGICLAEIGEACVALYGRIAGERPEGEVTELHIPHASRQRRRNR